MASVKRISGLTAATLPLTNTELSHIVQSSTNAQVSLNDLTGGLVTLPAGGGTNQVLTKLSATDGDVDWQDLEPIPNGGTLGQELTKDSTTEYDASFATPGAAEVARDGLHVFMDSPNQPSASGLQKIRLDGLSYDTQGMWDAVNERAQPTIAGYYIITAFLSRSNSAVNYYPIVQRDDGVSIILGSEYSSQSRDGGSGILYANGTTNHFELFAQSSNNFGDWIYRINVSYLHIVGPF